MTPTPIPFDQFEVPEQFSNYVFGFFSNIAHALRQIEIPFTTLTVWDVLLGTMVLGAFFTGIGLIYHTHDQGRKHE